jgi:hypothetical protein
MAVNFVPIVILKSIKLAQCFPLVFRNLYFNIPFIPYMKIRLFFGVARIVVQELAFGFAMDPKSWTDK